MGLIRSAIFHAIIFTSTLAAAEQPFTNLDAAKQNGLSSMAQGGITFVLNRIGQLTTTELVSHPTEPKALTDSEIDKIVRWADQSKTQNLGIGQLGGDRVIIEYDAQQVARMAGIRNQKALADAYREAVKSAAAAQLDNSLAIDMDLVNRAATELKPEYTVKQINTRTVSDLRSELKALAADSASVRSVTFRGLFATQGKRVLGALQIIFLGGSASNAAHSAYYAYNGLTDSVDTWQTSRCTQVQGVGGQQTVCNPPSILTYLFNTSDAIYYRFHADK